MHCNGRANSLYGWRIWRELHYGGYIVKTTDGDVALFLHVFFCAWRIVTYRYLKMDNKKMLYQRLRSKVVNFIDG